jgi:hypothetical protein
MHAFLTFRLSTTDIFVLSFALLPEFRIALGALDTSPELQDQY